MDAGLEGVEVGIFVVGVRMQSLGTKRLGSGAGNANVEKIVAWVRNGRKLGPGAGRLCVIHP